MKRKPIIYIFAALALYLVSSGLSYAVFTIVGAQPAQVALVPDPSGAPGKFVIDPSIPRTEKCPLNGKLFTKQERDAWEKVRPLAVMIENHPEARPQSGLSFADVVYEAVAEGGVTRFMGVFYCGISAYSDIWVAPVRSARTSYVDWVSEYDALYNHVGGAGRCDDPTVDERAKALCQIQKYGIKDLDQFYLKLGPKACRRNVTRLDHEVAWEHTVECNLKTLYTEAAMRGWTDVDEEGVAWDEAFTSWKFKEEAGAGGRGAVNSISFVHWDGYDAQFGIRWDYDASSNSYKRSMAGQPHSDFITKEQLTAKNVVIQFSKETVGVDEHAHVLYDTLKGDKALVFLDGQVISGTWKKGKRTARTVFYDEKGKEISFNPGQIWIEVIASGAKITY